MASKTKIKGGVVHDGKGKQFLTLEDAMANDTKCGCGLNCKKGYLALPNFNSLTGDIINFTAMYIVDGAAVYSTVEQAEAAINAFCINTKINAKSVTITGCPTEELPVEGGSAQLTATVNPAGSIQTGVWTTDAAGVATVSVTGLVTAVGTGTATITFTSTDGGFTSTCIINVGEAA